MHSFRKIIVVTVTTLLVAFPIYAEHCNHCDAEVEKSPAQTEKEYYDKIQENKNNSDQIDASDNNSDHDHHDHNHDHHDHNHGS